MKRSLFASLMIWFVIFTASCSWAGYYNEGHFGLTEDDAYVIDSIADMVEFCDRVNKGNDAEGSYYRLALNLNLEGTNCSRIGKSNPFTGHFDGGGHTIKVNWEIVLLTENCALFETIKTESGYAIKNLNVSGHVGCVAGTNANSAGIALELYNASIENCSFTGEVLAKSQYGVSAYAGGIVARMYSGTIKNCTVKKATINAHPYFVGNGKGYPGGIVSMMAGGTIEGCRVEEDVIVAGVSQKDRDGTQAGKVSAGGIVGILNRSEGTINRGSVKNNVCYAQIEVANNAYAIGTLCAGGIIGEIGETNISVTDNAYDGDISGSPANTSYIGGVIGKISGSNVPTISNNYYKGAAFGIGYDAGGEASDEPGCKKGTPPSKTPLSISGSLSNGVLKKSYSKKLEAIGGVAPYTWSKSSGTLPTGLKLGKTTGKLSGTPTASGSFTFKIKVTDSDGDTATKSYTVKITKPAISGTLSNGAIKASYSKTLKASGGTSPYTWTKSSGTLPTGLKLGKTTGKLTGTPTEAGSFTFKVKATDANGATATKSYTVTITKPSISGTLSDGVIKASYSKTLKASGGTSPYTWTKSSGTLPTGLKLGKTTGKLSGTPTEAGSFTFKVKATDANGATATKSYTVTITKPTISGSLGSGTVGKSYSKTLKATGGTASYTWTKSSGTLPTGLKLGKTTGKLSGTPTTAGKFKFTVKVTDANKATATKSYTVTIKESAATLQSEPDDYISEPESPEDESLTPTDDIEPVYDTDSRLTSTESESDGSGASRTELHVLEDDVLSQGTERDDDLVIVRANQPVRFIIGTWPHEVDDERVYVDDEPIEGIEISEGTFTLPAEMIHDDIKVQVKAGELETRELYVSAEE